MAQPGSLGSPGSTGDLKRIIGISIAGKTFYWNINKSRNGAHYLTIVAKKSGTGASEEKLTLFDSQILSFVHKTLEAYGEICDLNGVLRLDGLGKGPSAGTGTREPEVPNPPEIDVPVCGKCEMKPGKWYEDRNLESMGAIHVFISDETGNFLIMKCQNCGWSPDDTEKNADGYGVYRRNTPGFNHWAPWAQ